MSTAVTGSLSTIGEEVLSPVYRCEHSYSTWTQVWFQSWALCAIFIIGGICGRKVSNLYKVLLYFENPNKNIWFFGESKVRRTGIGSLSWGMNPSSQESLISCPSILVQRAGLHYKRLYHGCCCRYYGEPHSLFLLLSGIQTYIALLL